MQQICRILSWTRVVKSRDTESETGLLYIEKGNTIRVKGRLYVTIPVYHEEV